MKTILILSAHPDDEVLGIGGSIQYFKEQGYQVEVCCVTDGSSTQYKNNSQISSQKNLEHEQAFRLLNIDRLIRLSFPDMQLDTVPHYLLNEELSKVFSEVKPEIIFTHSEHDLNKDHRLIYDSSLVITRFVHRPENSFFKKLMSYEVLSSSEWNMEKPFLPNFFINIEKYLSKKKEAFSYFKTEIRPYPHSRSLEGIDALAKYRGLQSGFRFAEGFKIIKSFENYEDTETGTNSKNYFSNKPPVTRSYWEQNKENNE